MQISSHEASKFTLLKWLEKWFHSPMTGFYTYPGPTSLPQPKQSYESACDQLRSEQIERMFEAIVEQRRNEEDDE